MTIRAGLPTAFLSAMTSLLAASCQSDPSSGPPAYQVTHQPPTTVITTINSDGSVSTTHLADPELVGRKEVHYSISMYQPMTIKNVIIAYWPAGRRDDEQSVEIDWNQSYEPATPAGVGTFVFQEIPGAENFDTCQGLYYMMSFSYTRENGPDGLYISQPSLILPTKKRRPNGAIEQALCAAPPGPDV